MVASEVMGMLLMAIAAVAAQLTLVLQTIMTEWNMPFHFILGCAEILLCIPLFWLLCIKGGFSMLKRSDLKWIWLRGLCGTLAFVFQLLAIHNGAHMGDVSALGSINVVVAAALGRTFLGESLHALHVIAISLSVAGAFVITKPEALLGLKHVDGGVPYLGYLLAMASGFASGGLFIASRKSQHIDGWVMTLSVALQEGFSVWLLVVTGLVVEHPAAQIASAPLEAGGCLALMICIVIVSIFSMNLGSQKCPAAMSSTIFTSLQLSAAYTSQVLLSRKAPDNFSIIGSVMMLTAVALMALSRWRTSQKSSADAEAEVEAAPGPVVMENESSSGGASTYSAASDVDDTESLASFVAHEFSGLTPSSENIRQRHTRVAATIMGASDGVAA